MSLFSFLISLFSPPKVSAPAKVATPAPAPAAKPVATYGTAVVQTAVASKNPPIDYTAYSDGNITAEEAYNTAVWLRNNFVEIRMADPFMATVMAVTEAGGNSPIIKVNTTRYEPGFFAKYLAPIGITDKNRATSFGVMQVMLNTALEDYARGYTSYGKPTATNLKNPLIGLYFGMAHQVYIRQQLAKKGIPVTERNIVMSYNGGIGANNSDTQNHYNKYAANKAVVTNAIA